MSDTIIFNIQATFNNTIVTATDIVGNTIASCSAGEAGFKGTKKSTPYAAGVIVEETAKKVRTKCGEKRRYKAIIHLKGPGQGRDSAARAVKSSGFNVISVVEKTSIPHNGVRRKKRRRV